MRKIAAVFGFMLAGTYGAQLAWVIFSPEAEDKRVDLTDETLSILRQNAIGLWLLGALFCAIAINAYIGGSHERARKGVSSLVVPLAVYAWHLHHGDVGPAARPAQAS